MPKEINLKVITEIAENPHWFQTIINTLNNVDCTRFVDNLTNLTQTQQRVKVNELQDFILEILNDNHNNFNWNTEFKINETNKDAIDIYGSYDNRILIIELDKWRADQVAKKIISRAALLIDNEIGYISLCYGGTQNMNKAETIKYFKYGEIIMSRLNNVYAGMIIE